MQGKGQGVRRRGSQGSRARRGSQGLLDSLSSGLPPQCPTPCLRGGMTGGPATVTVTPDATRPSGLRTETVKLLPVVAASEGRSVALSCAPLMNVVMRSAPLIRTTDSGTKFAPLTIITVAPRVTVATELICGVPAETIVRITGAESDDGPLRTLIAKSPGSTRSAPLMVNVSEPSAFAVVGCSAPLKMTFDVGRKAVPMMWTLASSEPIVRLPGSIEVMFGRRTLSVAGDDVAP